MCRVSHSSVHHLSLTALTLISVTLLMPGMAFATGAVEDLTGYAAAEFKAAPTGESLISFDWDNTGALYYMTGDPNWGLKLNVYRNVNGNETAIFQSTAVFFGSRITSVGPLVYFNDGGDYYRYTYNYYSYDPLQGGAPTLSYDSATQPLSLWGIGTRDGTQFFASGATGTTSSIYYMPAPADGILDELVSLGEIGESSGPVAFDNLGNLYYAHGYVFSGQAKIFRWTAAELAAAIANPVLAPLSPVGHEWAVLPVSFTGAGGMALDAAGNVYVTANAGFSSGELLLYRAAPDGTATPPVSLARCASRLETLRLYHEKLYFNCTAGIYSMSVPLSVSLATDSHVHAVAGKQVSLSVVTRGGEGSLSYEWFMTGFGKSDVSLGNNAPTITLTPTLGENGKGVYCAVTDSGLTVHSPQYTLEVVMATPATSITALAALSFALSLAGICRSRRKPV